MLPMPKNGFRLKIGDFLLYKKLKGGNVMSEQEHAVETHWLAQAGLRPTRQRVTLARLLVGDGQDRHVTAESLFEAAKGQGDAVSLATVYNTLRAFCDAGLLQEVTVDGSKSYFDTNTHDHPHFFWEDEDRLTDAPSEQLVIAQLPDAPDGAEIASVDVVIRLRRKG
jgi:Fur family transcriptional regulator, iron response regulator